MCGGSLRDGKRQQWYRDLSSSAAKNSECSLPLARQKRGHYGSMTDVTDDLLQWRKQFSALDDCVHLISHSLGCMPDRARDYMNEFMDLWQKKSITAWDEWLPAVDEAGARIEKLLCAPAGTVTMNTNCSAVQSVVASCFDFSGKRNKIVYSELNFTTLSYVWKEQERLGAKVHLVPSEDGIRINTQAICDAIDETTAIVPISHVIFCSAYIQDAKKICQKAASVGAHVVLDCYQSLGIIPVDIVDIGASFACGGSVKYLCGGAGAAYLYVRKDLVEKFEPRVTGWFGHQSPFVFSMPKQQYADSIWRYMGGTPAISALYQAKAGQEIVGEIGVTAIRKKSLHQTQKAIDWIDELGFTLNSPRQPEQRGGSVVFDFVGAADIARELGTRRYFCDHRPGVGIRIAPHFYTKDEEIDLFFQEVTNIRGKGQ